MISLYLLVTVCVSDATPDRLVDAEHCLEAKVVPDSSGVDLAGILYRAADELSMKSVLVERLAAQPRRTRQLTS
jgi:hypothetical protein